MREIKFYKIAEAQPAIKLLTEQLLAMADRGSLLLLLSGGSAIPAEVAVLGSLQSVWPKLTISLIDERFGETGHADSNWTQLVSAGLPANINHREVLTGKPFEQTVADFDNFLTNALGHYDQIVGILGLGADGHTAGLLPASPALTAETYAAGYPGPDYRRITTTPEFLKKLNATYLYALGESKWPQLKRLEMDLAIADQPAQILKQVDELIVFNDLLGQPLA